MQFTAVIALLFASVAVAAPAGGKTATASSDTIGPKEELPAGCPEPPHKIVGSPTIMCAAPPDCRAVFCGHQEVTVPEGCPLLRTVPGCVTSCCPNWIEFKHAESESEDGN